MSAHNGLTSQPLPIKLSNALYPLTKEQGSVLPWDVEDHHVMKRLKSTKTDGLCWSSGMKRNAIRHSLAHLSPQGMTTQLALIQNISKITQNRNNLPCITQTTITWNLNTATKTRLKNTTNNRWRVEGKLYNFRGEKAAINNCLVVDCSSPWWWWW